MFISPIRTDRKLVFRRIAQIKLISEEAIFNQSEILTDFPT